LFIMNSKLTCCNCMKVHKCWMNYIASVKFGSQFL
jgi:hypothetical protein